MSERSERIISSGRERIASRCAHVVGIGSRSEAMPLRRRLSVFAAPVLGLLAVLAVATPAAAVTTAEKLAVMSQFTQTSTASYNSWNAARQNQAAWAEYGFNWSTDYCSSSPDQPLGFDFRLSCHRHDWGYRNYKAMSEFTAANKDRIDNAFYQDLLRKCRQYNSIVRPACNSLAWTYYQAVRQFATLVIAQADIDRAADMKARAEARAAGAS
jgi:hypothetical protein